MSSATVSLMVQAVHTVKLAVAGQRGADRQALAAVVVETNPGSTTTAPTGTTNHQAGALDRNRGLTPRHARRLH